VEIFRALRKGVITTALTLSSHLENAVQSVLTVLTKTDTSEKEIAKFLEGKTALAQNALARYKNQLIVVLFFNSGKKI
jgi:hypothetical protein